MASAELFSGMAVLKEVKPQDVLHESLMTQVAGSGLGFSVGFLGDTKVQGHESNETGEGASTAMLFNYIPGRNLEEATADMFLENLERVPDPPIRLVMAQAVFILKVVADLRIVHRDVKPGNLMVLA